MIKVNEIYASIQGESTYTGLPCVFIRLSYCNLRCTYCDSEFAFFAGSDMTIEEIVDRISPFSIPLVEITGGEPLVQKETIQLIKALADVNYKVLVETSGSLPINEIDSRATIIMDIKCPSSGMAEKNMYENISYLKSDDEVKFVIGTREDYEWTLAIMNEYSLSSRANILFSCIFGSIEPVDIVNWMLADNVRARFQLQVHKYIWHPEKRGV